jgi:hypothetical protein
MSCREPVHGRSEPTKAPLGESPMLKSGVRKVVVGGAPAAKALIGGTAVKCRGYRIYTTQRAITRRVRVQSSLKSCKVITRVSDEMYLPDALMMG